MLDTTEGLHQAGEGKWLFPEMDLDADDSRMVPPEGTHCQCRACSEGLADLHSRVSHANAQYHEEEGRVRFFLGQGRLRELVEARTVSHPALGEMLRHFDTLGLGYQEAHAPVVSRAERPYGISESYLRPEMERFRRRFVERYAPPGSKRTLALFPCSYTKPYSNSPTHRAFSKAIGAARKSYLIHTVSVTSPLGVVPRDLENTYPARNYDIPVTGRWTEEERTWVREGLRALMERGGYVRTIVHLPEEEFSWLGKVLSPSEKCVWTVGSMSPTSKAALLNLENEARRLPTEPISLERVRVDEARSSLSYQFSPKIADALLDGEVSLRGPRWFLSLDQSGTGVLATWKEDRGLWRLTMLGASKILAEARDWCVEVDKGITLKGDLFAPGAQSGGSELRIGSDALLVEDGRLVGIGEAVVPGTWMGRLEHGLVVRVRHHGERPEAGHQAPDVGESPGGEN
jgi:archaeosine synthase